MQHLSLKCYVRLYRRTYIEIQVYNIRYTEETLYLCFRATRFLDEILNIIDENGIHCKKEP